MSAQDNKATVQRIVEEIFNNKKLALIDKYIASDVIDHSAPPGLPPGIEGYRYGNLSPELEEKLKPMGAQFFKPHSGTFDRVIAVKDAVLG